MLLNEVLAALAPDVLSLHGNALVHPSWGVIFLMGASGAGKSTLTRELLQNLHEAHGRWKLVAEDFLVLAPAQRTMWPFPRAAGLRDCPADAAPVLARTGFNTHTEARGIVAYDSKDLVDANTPVALDRVTVVLLETGPSPGASTPSQARPTALITPARATLFLSWCDEATLHMLAHTGLDVLEHEVRDACWRIVLGAYPTEAQVLRLDAACAEMGIMLLALTAGDAELAAEGRRRRPPQPMSRHLTTREGLLCMLHHLRRPRAHLQMGASQSFMMLASSLPHAVFTQLVPGGTPADTRDCLMQLLESSTPRS